MPFPSTYSQSSKTNAQKKKSCFNQVLDPIGWFFVYWDRIFLAFCLIALYVDPLHFYIPYVGGQGCIKIHWEFFIFLSVIRSLCDIAYFMDMVFKFRTAFIMRGSAVVSRGQLVMDRQKIASQYLQSDFKIDLIASIPLPQILQMWIWIVVPTLRTHKALHSNNALALIILLQYVLRLFLLIPLHGRIIRNAGVVTRPSWAGAAYNLLLYLLASHVLGAAWYLLSVQRQLDCWHTECEKNRFGMFYCIYNYFDCKTLGNENRDQWMSRTSVLMKCNATEEIQFNYGIFAEALKNNVVSANFLDKHIYCFSWGLKTLSSLGQNLETSKYIPEALFCFITCIIGVVLFAFLIANIQTYFHSIRARLEELRVQRRDAEEWMRHRGLPPDIQQRVRRYLRFRWLSTRGVDEETILRSLSSSLRRDIQRHICLDFLMRVPLFSNMDNQLLDAVCERLVLSLSIKDARIVREGDPVNEMLFVVRGEVESSTTNGGRSGFFNSTILKPGDFCGEELLMWALMPSPNQNLPPSTRTLRALCEVEAFALRANDLNFVSNQFKRLNNKKFLRVFKYYSHQWRTTGAIYIQASWRRFKRKRLARELRNTRA